MSVISIILQLVANVIILAAIIIGVVLYLKKHLTLDKVPPNSPIAICFAGNRSGGSFIGLETSIEGDTYRAERCLVKYKPLDIKYIGNDPQPAPIRDFPIKKSKRCAFPKGSLSTTRDIIFYLPESISDLDRSFLQTDIGQALGIGLEVLNQRDLIVETSRAKDISTTETVRQLESGALSKDLIDKLRAMMVESVVKELDHKPSN